MIMWRGKCIHRFIGCRAHRFFCYCIEAYETSVKSAEGHLEGFFQEDEQRLVSWAAKLHACVCALWFPCFGLKGC